MKGKSWKKTIDDVGERRVGIIDGTTRRYFARSGIERVFSHLHADGAGCAIGADMIEYPK